MQALVLTSSDTASDKCSSIFSLLCFLWCLRTITSSHPTHRYWTSLRGHSFLCASMSSRQTFDSLSQLLGQGRGNLGHCSLCKPSINWCSPASWQYWQLRTWHGHSVSICPVISSFKHHYTTLVRTLNIFKRIYLPVLCHILSRNTSYVTFVRA